MECPALGSCSFPQHEGIGAVAFRSRAIGASQRIMSICTIKKDRRVFFRWHGLGTREGHDMAVVRYSCDGYVGELFR